MNCSHGTLPRFVLWYLTTLRRPHAGAAAYCCQCAWVGVAASDGYVMIRRAGGVGVPVGTGGGSEDGGIVARTGGNGWAAWACAGHDAT